MLWVLVLGAILIWAPSPTITHRTTAERAHIKPKPCSVNGIEGTCMFVYECIKTDGKHVGMCVDNFMFGSCCSHNVKQNSIIPNHHHHNHHHHQSNPNVLYSSSSIYSSPRPPNHSLGGRPQTNKLRPAKPVGFLTYQTKKPPSTTYHHWLKEPSDSSSSTTATSHKQLGSNSGGVGKPWTNRPSPFVTSSDSGLKPSFPDVKFPAIGNAATEITQSLIILKKNSSLADGGNSSTSSTAYNLIATSKPANIGSLQGRNKTLSATTVKTTSSTTTSKTTEPTTTSTTQSAAVTNGKPSTSWSTTKPSWHPNNIVASSKPWSQLLKPENHISEKPSFLTSQTVWTNEPHFVTRPRPQSNLWLKPKPTRKPVPYSGSLGSSSIRSNLTSNEKNEFGVSTSSSTANLTTQQSTTAAITTTTISTTTTSSSSTLSLKPENFTDSTTAATTATTAGATMTTMTSESIETTTAFSKHSKYQYSGQCGVATLSPRPEMRIVGGKNAAFGGWPWQVSVRRTSFFGFSSTHRCGGAVINENWIATAGHCVDDLLTSQIRIRVGEYDFSSVQEPYPFVERSASKKVVHPKYNFFTYEYDLALVRLETSLEFQPHISPICLPASDDLLIGENATVTGWGRLSEGGTLPSVLQQVSVPIVSNDKCKSMFLRAGRHEFIPEIFLCAGYENGGQDSCQGDSGGPLQVKGKNGRYFLAGIISWGIGCAEANLPGVCTRISKFVPWILENVT